LAAIGAATLPAMKALKAMQRSTTKPAWPRGGAGGGTAEAARCRTDGPMIIRQVGACSLRGRLGRSTSLAEDLTR
jgi:hypothetical protein